MRAALSSDLVPSTVGVLQSHTLATAGNLLVVAAMQADGQNLTICDDN